MKYPDGSGRQRSIVLNILPLYINDLIFGQNRMFKWDTEDMVLKDEDSVSVPTEHLAPGLTDLLCDPESPLFIMK